MVSVGSSFHHRGTRTSRISAVLGSVGSLFLHCGARFETIQILLSGGCSARSEEVANGLGLGFDHVLGMKDSPEPFTAHQAKTSDMNQIQAATGSQGRVWRRGVESEWENLVG